jgi:hypothetical protein
MISKKHFLEQVDKLMLIYDEQISTPRAMAYYEMLSQDFTDEQFDAAVNMALKSSFKFPPIAAFYRKDVNTVEEKTVYEPVTLDESQLIKGVLDRYGL